MEKITFEEALRFIPFIYVAVISVIAIFITCYDKIAAKKLPGRRTPEATLLFVSILGGSIAMYITMQLIRHKTRHKKFMLGIPLIILLQIALAILVWWFM